MNIIKYIYIYIYINKYIHGWELVGPTQVRGYPLP